MKHTIITLWLVHIILSIWGYTFAQFDCNLSDEKILLPYINKTTEWPFDIASLKVVSRHLRSYCNKNSEWAESPYIFDHLVNIGFRKLDAIVWKTYDLTPDTNWIEWQNKITAFSTQFSDSWPGKTPVTQNTLGKFITDFTKYWPSTAPWISLTNSCAVPNYDSLPLYSKYIATCEIARCISDDILQITNTTNASTDTSKNILTNNLCSSITTNRFISEAIQTKQLITRVWIRSITNTISSYSENYFIWNRRQNLFDKMTLFDQYMTFVNHKVQEWTPNCSK